MLGLIKAFQLLAVLPALTMAQITVTSGPEPTLQYCPPQPASAAEQEAIFEQFRYQFLIAKNLTRAYSYVSEDFIQHNENIPNGREGTVGYLAPFWAQVQDTILHTAYAEGFGWIHHASQSPGQPSSVIFDLYRFEGSCIVEHWDAIEAFPTNATNPNPLW